MSPVQKSSFPIRLLVALLASFVRFPEQGFATWVLCNMGSIRPSGLGLQVADIFLAAEMRR